MFSEWFKRKRFPWPEDKIVAGRKEVRLIGVKLNPKPCVYQCYTCSIGVYGDKKRKYLPYLLIFENKTVKRVCETCGNAQLRNLMHRSPPKKYDAFGDMGTE